MLRWFHDHGIITKKVWAVQLMDDFGIAAGTAEHGLDLLILLQKMLHDEKLWWKRHPRVHLDLEHLIF